MFECVFFLGSGNPLDTNHYSPIDVQHGKSNNIPNSNYHYHEHVNKSNKFLDSPSNRKYIFSLQPMTSLMGQVRFLTSKDD